MWKEFTYNQLTTDPTPMLKATFSKLGTVLHPDLRTHPAVANIQAGNEWQYFTGQFFWAKPQAQVHMDICMPFDKEVVVSKPRAANKAPHTYHVDGYLRVYLGDDDNKRAVQELAHRLLCLCWWGEPQGDPADKWKKIVVNHKCKNPGCLNPRHLGWVSRRVKVLGVRV